MIYKCIANVKVIFVGLTNLIFQNYLLDFLKANGIIF